MKFQITNNEPLQFYNANGDLVGTIEISGSGDMILRPESGSSKNIIIGDTNTAADIQMGLVSAPINLELLGGGTITSNGNTLNIGADTDVVNIRNAVYSQSIDLTGSLNVSGSVFADNFIGTVLSSSYALTASHALNGGGGGGTTVVANPGGSPATALTTITIGGSDFSISGGGGSIPTGTVSGSGQITALGFVTSSATASFVTNSQTASMSVNSASFASTASLLLGSVQNAVSASHAITASFLIGGTSTPSGTISGSAQITALGFISSSATASLVSNSQTGSFVVNSQTSSFVINSQTGSFLTNASTASFNNLNITNPSGNLIPGNGSTSSIAVTVVNDGANRYVLDGEKTGSLTLVAGNAYKFDTSDSSNNGHPFAFKLASDSSTSYTTGVTVNGSGYTSPDPGQAGAYVQISVTNDTPDLIYYCTVHGNGMGGGAILSIQTGSVIQTGFLQVTGSVNILSGSITINSGSFIGDGSGLTGLVSASIAQTASFISSTFISASAAASGFGSGGSGGGGGGSSSTNFTQSLFVTPSGNNASATVGDMLKPFHTILAATASANIGDSIIIYPGTYPSESANIIKDGVNYYFYPGAIVHPTSSLTEYVVDIEDPVHPVNVRGHGTFISDDTTYGAIRIQAKECYFEFDTAKTTNNTTSTFNQGGTVNLEPTNADSGRSSTNNIKGNPFYVNGKIINTGNFGTYGGALVLGRSGLTDYSSLIFEGSVMQLHPTDASPAIFVPSNKTTYDFSVNANVFASASQAVYSIGRGAVRLRGIYSTGDRNNKYAIELTDGYRTYYDIDAHINGAVKLNTGANTNSGGILRGTILTSGTPDDAAIYINGGGQHKIDNQIFMRDSGGFGIKIDTDPAQVEFTGDFNADANSSYINFCKVTTGKLIFKGSLGSSANRGNGNIINGGHLVIDSFFDNDGSTYPSNAYCFQLSAGTLEINNKVTHAYNTTGSGIVDMTGGYLKLNAAELVQLNGTGSFAHCIDLNGGAHSGSILNNSFTNVNPFGPGSFTNEIVGGGTLFETDKLY